MNCKKSQKINNLIHNNELEKLINKYFKTSEEQLYALTHSSLTEFVTLALNANVDVLNNKAIVTNHTFGLIRNGSLFKKLYIENRKLVIDECMSSYHFNVIADVYFEDYFDDDIKKYVKEKLENIGNPVKAIILNQKYSSINNGKQLPFYQVKDNYMLDKAIEKGNPFSWIKDTINLAEDGYILEKKYDQVLINKVFSRSDITNIDKLKFKLYLGVYYDEKYLKEFSNYENLLKAVYLCNNKGIHESISLLNDVYVKYGIAKYEKYSDEQNESFIKTHFLNNK